MVAKDDQMRLEQLIGQKVQINTETAKIRFQGGDPETNEPNTSQMESEQRSFAGVLTKVTANAITIKKWWGWRQAISYVGKEYSWRIGCIQESGSRRIISVTANGQTLLFAKNS